MTKLRASTAILACLIPVLCAACGGAAKVDRDQGDTSGDHSGTAATETSGAAGATTAPETAAAETKNAEPEKVVPSADKLVVKLNGENVAMKRAFAYAEAGSMIMLLVTNNEEMDCKTYFAPSGRAVGADERTFFVTLSRADGEDGAPRWKIFSVMVNSQSQSGQDLGKVRLVRGTASDQVQTDLAFAVEGPAIPNVDPWKLEVDGSLVAEGCGKNPAGL